MALGSMWSVTVLLVLTSRDPRVGHDVWRDIVTERRLVRVRLFAVSLWLLWTL